MTEEEARTNAIYETCYCYGLAVAWSGEEKKSICLERIYTKEHQQEEIRLAWWNDGRFQPRPADIDAVNWVSLFREAINEGVFNQAEQLDMIRALLGN